MEPTSQRIVLLTDGHSDPLVAKTAVCVIRYRPQDVVAVLDRSSAGQTTGALLGVGGQTPVIGDLAAAEGANTLMIGIAPPGGKVPVVWRPILLEALSRGMNVVSGLHQFLSDDPELSAAAREHGATITDVRKNTEREVASGQGFRDDAFRVLTIGQDCSIGKMVAAVEMTRELKRRDIDAKFVATGQTGIMIEGDGCPIDCVVSDFVNGAVEKLVLERQQHEVLIIEGQATIAHPRYSCVSAGLLHGSRPHAMVMVYEPGRTHVHGMPHVPLASVARTIEAYENLAALMQPAKVVALAMNSRKLSPDQAAQERERMRGELGLPVADPIRDGAGELIDAVLAHRDRLGLTVATR